MDQATAAKLRAPFSDEAVGKRPQPTCKQCSDAPSRVCNSHLKTKCRECGQYMTTAHVHLDYVGHADVTARLLEVDPDWEWEPFAVGADGLPALDGVGGLWIRLTIAGKTRIGYGDAQGKKGPNAVKEAIGDALRNAGMRFGVGLDMWMKGDREAPQHDSQPVTPATAEATRAEPDVLRDEIKKLAATQSPAWNLATIAQGYTQDYPGRDLKTETDPDPIRVFLDNLRAEASRPTESGAA